MGGCDGILLEHFWPQILIVIIRSKTGLLANSGFFYFVKDFVIMLPVPERAKNAFLTILNLNFKVGFLRVIKN